MLFSGVGLFYLYASSGLGTGGAGGGNKSVLNNPSNRPLLLS